MRVAVDMFAGLLVGWVMLMVMRGDVLRGSSDSSEYDNYNKITNEMLMSVLCVMGD